MHGRWLFSYPVTYLLYKVWQAWHLINHDSFMLHYELTSHICNTPGWYFCLQWLLQFWLRNLHILLLPGFLKHHLRCFNLLQCSLCCLAYWYLTSLNPQKMIPKYLTKMHSKIVHSTQSLQLPHVRTKLLYG